MTMTTPHRANTAAYPLTRPRPLQAALYLSGLIALSASLAVACTLEVLAF
jgi:hypothetical protein